MPNCTQCHSEISVHRSSDLCYDCEQDYYEKIRPNWRDPHPCEMCGVMIHYKEGLSFLEWGTSYYSCCSDECREKLIDLNYPNYPYNLSQRLDATEPTEITHEDVPAQSEITHEDVPAQSEITHEDVPAQSEETRWSTCIIL